MKPTYEELEQQLAESHRALRAETTAHDNLKMQLEKMAAENAGMKAAAKKVIKMNRQHAKDQHGDPMIAESWACVKVLRKAKSETPVTDAFLAEVRAQGVDAAIEELNQLAGRSEKEAPIAAGHHRAASLFLKLFADKLRKGVQS